MSDNTKYLTCHKDGTVSLFLTYDQVWMRLKVWQIEAREVASMTGALRAKFATHVRRHLPADEATTPAKRSIARWAQQQQES